MNEKLEKYIYDQVGINVCGKSLREITFEVILPLIAGTNGRYWRIHTSMHYVLFHSEQNIIDIAMNSGVNVKGKSSKELALEVALYKHCGREDTMHEAKCFEDNYSEEELRQKALLHGIDVEQCSKHGLALKLIWENSRTYDANKRNCISDKFMEFVPLFFYDIHHQDKKIAINLLKIALQRISCTLMSATAENDPAPLDTPYWEFSSNGSKNKLNKACYDFIMNGAIEIALENKSTRDCANDILFGIMECCTPDGTECCIATDDELKSYAMMKKLYARAEELVEERCGEGIIYKHYTLVGQWEKHLDWLQKHNDIIDWNEFFKSTMALENLGPLSRIRKKYTIKQMICSTTA